jgi:hypothetical protein
MALGVLPTIGVTDRKYWKKEDSMSLAECLKSPFRNGL